MEGESHNPVRLASKQTSKQGIHPPGLGKQGSVHVIARHLTAGKGRSHVCKETDDSRPLPAEQKPQRGGGHAGLPASFPSALGEVLYEALTEQAEAHQVRAAQRRKKQQKGTRKTSGGCYGQTEEPGDVRVDLKQKRSRASQH